MDNPGDRVDSSLEEGAWVLRMDRRDRPEVGRVVAAEYPGGGGGRANARCRVRFELGPEEWFDGNRTLELNEAFDQSGFAQTKGGKSATAVVRQ